MKIDYEKLDEAVLAVLYLTYDDSTGRAWKGLDWDALDRLYSKGLIDDPKNKNRSVVLTEAGSSKAKEAFKKLFSK